MKNINMIQVNKNGKLIPIHYVGAEVSLANRLASKDPSDGHCRLEQVIGDGVIVMAEWNVVKGMVVDFCFGDTSPLATPPIGMCYVP